MTFDNRGGATLPPGVWFREEVKEMPVFSEQYDMVMSLLLLGDTEPRWRHRDDEGEDPVSVPVGHRWR